jgi:hypothetical protein
MHKSATKCNETQGKWCKNKHGASKIIDTFETYQAPVDPLLLSFGSLEAPGQNKTSGTYFVQFREYFLCITSETQKQQKTGNWHYGNLLVG